MSDLERRFYMNAFIGVISAGSLAMLLKHQLEIFFTSRERKQLAKANQYTMSELKDEFTQESNSIWKGKVFLAGIVQHSNPLHSEFISKPSRETFAATPVVYKIKYDQQVFSLDNLDPKSVSYQKMDFPENAIYSKLPAFKLVDQKNQENIAEVLINADVDVSSVLQYLASKDNFRRLSIGEKFLAFIISFLKVLTELSMGKQNPLSSKFRGLQLGIRETEVGIKVNTTLMAYGEVVYDFATNTCRISAPKLLTCNKKTLISNITEKLKRQRWMRNTFGVIFGLSMVYFGRRFWHWNRKQQMILKQEEMVKVEWDMLKNKVELCCTKKKNNEKPQNDEDLVQWLDENEGKELPKQCTITETLQYDDQGTSCIQCKSWYIDSKARVLEYEEKIENIKSNVHSQGKKKQVEKERVKK